MLDKIISWSVRKLINMQNCTSDEIILNLRVPDLRNVCIERCENDLLDCIMGCNNDVQCVSDCIRIQTECISSKLDLSVRISNDHFLLVIKYFKVVLVNFYVWMVVLVVKIQSVNARLVSFFSF